LLTVQYLDSDRTFALAPRLKAHYRSETGSGSESRRRTDIDNSGRTSSSSEYSEDSTNCTREAAGNELAELLHSYK